jgi:hypothetical protein
VKYEKGKTRDPDLREERLEGWLFEERMKAEPD